MPALTRLYEPKTEPARVAAFMSGSGSNVTRLLELQQKLDAAAGSPFQVVVIVTDCADREHCKAREIAARFGGLPVIEEDIQEFYADRGHPKVSVRTDRGFDIREEYTAVLWERLQPIAPDFAALGGFESLTNLWAKMVAINVHPGDLSVMVDGQRHLVGLHTIPIKRAILMGLAELRSTTILATAYTKALETDEGPVLAISRPLPIELPPGVTVGQLRRRGNRPRLEQIAREHQGRLKEVGDWEVFPLSVQLVAEGRFALDATGTVYFDRKPLDCGMRIV